MALNGISTLMIASGTTLTKNINPPHSNTEIVAPFSAIWSLNYTGALGAINNVSYKLYVTSLGIGSAVTLTSHQTGDFAVTAGNFLYDEYGTSIGIIKGNTTIDNYMAKAAAVCGSLNATIITAATYKGTWNAFTNTPTLTNGVGTLGDAYDTTVTGTSGAFPAYSEQDWRIYDGSVWQRVAKTTTTQWTITPATGGLADKEARQNAKLSKAEAKRQGKTVAGDGTITGSKDNTKLYYREANNVDTTLLPTVYIGNVVTTQSHPDGLIEGRPWIYSIVTSGLLLQLDAGDSASYPGSGTTWTDLSTYQNDATLTNGPSFISSGSASYLSFNGTNQFAPVTTSKMNVTYTGKTTMFAIRTVNANTGNAIYRNLFGGSTAARNFNTYMYHISGTTWRLHLSTGPASPWAYSASSSFTVTDNQWIVVAATQTTDGVVTYYVNGQPIGTPNTGVTFYQFINSGIEAVARSDNYWRGDIGSVAIYGQALNASQIQQNFNALRGRYGL